MTIKCPHCGEVCESDEDIPVGQHIECPFCANKFYYGMDNTEATFCGYCGAKIPATASFCPGCGRGVVGEEANAIETTAAADPTVEIGASAVEYAAGVKGESHGYFQKMLQLIAVTIFLSIISTIVSCIDIRESYSLGRVGCFLFGVASLAIQIWLYVALKQLKSWARKSLIAFNLLGAAFFVLGIGSGFENLFVFILGIVVCLIDLYNVCLCFQEEVVAVFKPDSELKDARAVVNTMHCFGFWLAEGLVIVAGVIWVILHQGTDAWDRDCTAAAVAGSSSAREELIEFAADKLANQGYSDPVEAATELTDSYISKRSPTPSRTRGNAPKPLHIFLGLKFLGKAFVVLAAVFGGIAKFKNK